MIISLEHSPSNRATCRICQKLIDKGELRVTAKAMAHCSGSVHFACLTSGSSIAPHEHAKIINRHTQEGFDALMVTCPHCGKIFLTNAYGNPDELTCSHCERTDEACYFSDLFY